MNMKAIQKRTILVVTYRDSRGRIVNMPIVGANMDKPYYLPKGATFISERLPTLVQRGIVPVPE